VRLEWTQGVGIEWIFLIRKCAWSGKDVRAQEHKEKYSSSQENEVFLFPKRT
jgi:hypothetical protein